ncbi:MAG: hypothetical protein JW804_03830 [Sedimentisphaerales bacterium]|nr:hypothetical protein [Sedimentisphaerales bacterium]
MKGKKQERKTKIYLITALILLVSGSPAVWAYTLAFSTSDNQFNSGIDNQGWWSDTMSNEFITENYAIGVNPTGNYSRNFFTFDLSSLSDAVLSATLQLTRFKYLSTADSETLGIFDVTTDAATLNDKNGINAAIYNDLGSGTSYGQFEVLSTGSEDDVLSFSLNSAAIANINSAAGGWFSIGGAILSFGSPIYGGAEGLFGFSHEEDGTQCLVLEVIPEPISVLLLGLGALLLRKQNMA